MTPAIAGVNDPGEACHRCQRHRWCHASPVSLILGSKYHQLRRCHWHRRSTGKVEYSKKIKIVTRLVYWGQEKLFEEKNQRWKIWWHCPFKLSPLHISYHLLYSLKPQSHSRGPNAHTLYTYFISPHCAHIATLIWGHILYIYTGLITNFSFYRYNPITERNVGEWYTILNKTAVDVLYLCDTSTNTFCFLVKIHL